MNDITKEGLERFKKELNYLMIDKTREIAALIKHTASFGDLKENAAYHDAKDKQAFLQGRIQELKSKISNARVIDKNQTGKVGLGSNVLISIDGEEEKMEIVSSGEADPIKGKLSYESPLGKATMEKSVGQEFEVDINGNKLKCKILKIE